MATAFVRDLDDAVYLRLKARAVGNNRSLEAELREILVLASKQVDMAAAARRPKRCSGGWKAGRTVAAGKYSPRNDCGKQLAPCGSP
jgi:plasmid stability protein